MLQKKIQFYHNFHCLFYLFPQEFLKDVFDAENTVRKPVQINSAHVKTCNNPYTVGSSPVIEQSKNNSFLKAWQSNNNQSLNSSINSVINNDSHRIHIPDEGKLTIYKINEIALVMAVNWKIK